MKRQLALLLAAAAAALAVLAIACAWPTASLPRRVAVFHSGYLTNASGVVSAVITLSNAGPQTFLFGGGLETNDSRGNWNYPSGIFMYYPGVALLGPTQSASLLIPLPSSPSRWRAKVVCRDMHGAGALGKLRCFWEERVSQKWEPDWYFAEEADK